MTLELGRARVVYCRGCQHAWRDDGAIALAQVGLTDLMDGCACTCTDDTDPHYEDWVTDPDPDGIPAGAWS